MSCLNKFRASAIVLGFVVLGTIVACGANTSGDDGECDPSVEVCTCTPGSNDCGAGKKCTNDGMCVADDQQCTNLQCAQVQCAGGGTTSISGTVFAPNGTLPLYNVKVYVPNGQVQPLATGLTCDRCGTLTGDPLVSATTDTAGNFVLENMPATDNVPLVIQVGRWRRQITIPTVPACTDTPLVAADTRLPRNKSEGDIPRMALSTGGADALECLLRKIGLEDSEITTSAGTGRLHLYTGVGGTDQFDAANGNMAFTNATTLWQDVTSLSKYDIVFTSCEGSRNEGQKSTAARQALKEFTDLGGRVLASHWHNVWIDAGPAPWPSTMTRVNLSDLNSITADVDQSSPKGMDLASWLLEVAASTTLGKIDITAAQHTVSAVNITMADRWIHLDTTANGQPAVQYLSFTTPLEQPADQRCGRVVYSDIHVASGDRSSGNLAFPSGGCTSNVAQLSPQEKVLAFMIFDIGSCIEAPLF